MFALDRPGGSIARVETLQAGWPQSHRSSWLVGLQGSIYRALVKISACADFAHLRRQHSSCHCSQTCMYTQTDKDQVIYLVRYWLSILLDSKFHSVHKEMQWPHRQGGSLPPLLPGLLPLSDLKANRQGC